MAAPRKRVEAPTMAIVRRELDSSACGTDRDDDTRLGEA
jgi:hypothetical protein